MPLVHLALSHGASGIIGYVQMGTGSAASALIAVFLPLGRPTIIVTALMAAGAVTSARVSRSGLGLLAYVPAP